MRVITSGFFVLFFVPSFVGHTEEVQFLGENRASFCNETLISNAKVGVSSVDKMLSEINAMMSELVSMNDKHKKIILEEESLLAQIRNDETYLPSLSLNMGKAQKELQEAKIGFETEEGPKYARLFLDHQEIVKTIQNRLDKLRKKLKKNYEKALDLVMMSKELGEEVLKNCTALSRMNAVTYKQPAICANISSA